MSEKILKTDEILLKTFIPEIYTDRIDDSIENVKDVLDSTRNGIYRFYGIFIGTKQKIGYIKYHVLFDSPIVEIDIIEVDYSYRDKGYGTMLMNQSLIDLVTDFPHIESVNVCSTIEAIPFYRKNKFEPYFGDNNLNKILKK